MQIPSTTDLPEIHPARLTSFDALLSGLRAARDRRLVYERPGPDGLRLFLYSERCVYDGAWDPITLAARGLILDPEARRIVATPFPKFFNIGERGQTIPNIAFEATEKLDGSLIIIFHHRDRWLATTKGGFDSAQALWAQVRLDALDLTPLLPGTTYLAEAVYPENRIVVRYDEPAMVMLAAYGEDGAELSYDDVAETASTLGWRVARRHSFASVTDLITHARTLPRSEEGFVIRFANGLRLKVKGEEYRRIHALITRVTPLAIWELLQAGDNPETVRREIPEEFWSDFDTITGLLDGSLQALLGQIRDAAAAVSHLSDKELGLSLGSFDEAVRSHIFPFRKSGGDILAGRFRGTIFNAVRPTGNELPGYVPSYRIRRVIEEAG